MVRHEGDNGGMDALLALLIVVALCPVLWQVPRTFWPVRLNASASGFTGIYRRYTIKTVTGRASSISTSRGSQTIGSVSASTSGMVIGGVYSGTTTVRDNRRTFVTDHTQFFVTDASGAVQPVDAVNVWPAIGEGHLVSVAWLVHNGKPGNAFLVYDHTTNRAYVEDSKRGVKATRRGLVKMVFKLPTLWVVILVLGIVTVPLLAILGLGAQWNVRRFRKHGVSRLLVSLGQRAAAIPPPVSVSPQFPSTVPNTAGGADLASQIRQITAMHESGALSVDEFQAAKAKLLGS